MVISKEGESALTDVVSNGKNRIKIIKHLKKEFDLVSIEGLCTLVPPSYIENFPEKHPKKYRWLRSKEDKWKGKWPWKKIGDYYIISLRKKN